MTLRLVFALPIILMLGACSDGTTAPKQIEQLPRPLTNSEQLLASGSTGFGLTLLREVNEQTGPDSNVFISPLSASVVLGMTATGAAGATLDSVRATLGYQGMDIADMDASYRGLIDLLRALDPRVDFRIANSIWHRNGLQVEQPFVDAATSYFDAEVSALDFDAPGAPGVINDWVNESTNGKIDKIVQSIPDYIWSALLAGLTEHEGYVYLPRFRLEWTDSLIEPLRAMGMGIAFDNLTADFSGISKEAHLFITSVDQKTFVNVDEEGTEAAAVTSVGAGVVSLPIPLIRADRPFLFAIRERLTGTLLFIGKMATPPT